jgi:hypothetical protein
MRRLFIPVVCALLLIIGSLPAFDAVGTIKKIDVENNLISIRGPDGQEHTVKIARNIKILGADDLNYDPARGAVKAPLLL